MRLQGRENSQRPKSADHTYAWEGNPPLKSTLPDTSSLREHFPGLHINTILTQMMADEFNFLWSQIQNYIAETDADLILVPGQLELHGGCRYGVLLSPCFCALFLVADLILGMEELELHCRCRCRSTILTETITSENKLKSQDLGFSLYWITKAKAKAKLISGILIHFVCVACYCALCVPNMIITKANAKENLGEFICLAITKANAKTNLQIFICNHFCVGGNFRKIRIATSSARMVRGKDVGQAPRHSQNIAED